MIEENIHTARNHAKNKKPPNIRLNELKKFNGWINLFVAHSIPYHCNLTTNLFVVHNIFTIWNHTNEVIGDPKRKWTKKNDETNNEINSHKLEKKTSKISSTNRWEKLTKHTIYVDIRNILQARFWHWFIESKNYKIHWKWLRVWKITHTQQNTFYNKNVFFFF